MNYRSALLSKAGPRKINEDAVGVWMPRSDCVFAAVADGLGGMGGGSRASELAVEILRIHSRDVEPSESSLVASARSIHAAILSEQKTRAELQTMATTLTAIGIVGFNLVGVHCGDTRAAVARGHGIRRLTEDHAEGARLYKAGKLTKDELMEYPRKHILDSALGMHRDPFIESFSFDLQPNDKLILTSDGMHQMVPLREMQGIASKYDDPEAFIEELEKTMSRKAADDNYSAVAVFVS